VKALESEGARSVALCSESFGIVWNHLKSFGIDSLKTSRNPMQQPQTSGAPLLSFAIPIRNGEKVLPKLLESLLAQDFSDFEIIISDNASTDRTPEVCREYASRNPRIRYHRNPENIGLNANFNLLIELARGKYIRWIGGDDRLEPDYARKCITAIEARPDVIGVSTYQDYTDDFGNRDYYEYTGKRLDSPHAYQRYARMVWFMTHDYRYIDPIYTMMRRDVLLQIGGHKPVLNADQVLAIEISLWGAFIHVPECLAHRGWKFQGEMPREQLLRQNFHQHYDKVRKHTYLNIIAAAWEPVMRLPLPWWEKLLCVPTIVYYFLRASRFEAEAALRNQLRPLKHTLRRYIKAS
jgi:glycosyltransferase involved in cell wall biosynthesis